ncbi:MAG TPA: hypothetical protein VN834_01440 [Candidatus Acidoferrum sp.]|nr:hypothetical protein [Candidatus Acidoferrum sp.]
MERLLGAAAAILTWLGWLAICPAFGFPTLGTAAMINRVIFRFNPEAGHEPNFWVGWSILIVALIGAIAMFFLLGKLRLVRASIRTGVIYGAGLWLVAGIVVMPILGLIQPAAIPVVGQPPDPMQATVMMYSLGPLASAAALIAWVLFGAILGATGTAQSRPNTAIAGAPAR